MDFMNQASFRTFCLLLAIAVLGLTACSRGPQPVVNNFDTFQTVQLGPISYTAPDGVRVTEKGPGYLVHEIERLPGVVVRVELDASPPRSLKLDADAAKRRFISGIPNGVLRSVQYDKLDQKEIIKVFADGNRETGEKLYGSMMMLRQGNRTARIKVQGPYEDRNQIENIMQRIAMEVKFSPGKA